MHAHGDAAELLTRRARDLERNHVAFLLGSDLDFVEERLLHRAFLDFDFDFRPIPRVQFDGAIESYSKAIALRPDYAEALNNRGYAWWADKHEYAPALADMERALSEAGLDIKQGDTVLLYTDHYRRAFGTDDWQHGPGISIETARWLGQQKIAAFGVEMASAGVRHVSNKEVHRICGELGFTHYENLINLYQLIGRGRFRFIGLPLKIRGGTGSPVRAVAVLED